MKAPVPQAAPVASPLALWLQPWLLGATALLAGCADRPLQVAQPSQSMREALQAQRAAPVPPAAASAPEAVALPVPAPAPALPPEPRFDLIVNGANARDVFLSLVSDTRYSMLVHPAVSGTLSVTLKGVTLRESLEAIREVYGFDYAIDGRRVTVFPPTLQTRVFTINALALQRSGRSEVRVSSGAAPVSSQNGSGNTPAAAGTTGGSNTVLQQESSQLSTKVANDFWAETATALAALVGNGEGRTVITSPQTGTVAVRAMPEELRHVEAWLKATRMAVERQVMLEAKIVEVELREGYQSGIDWSNIGSRGVVGQTSVNPSIPSGVNSIVNPLVSNSRGFPTLSTGTQQPSWSDLIPVPSAGGGTLGLALTRGGFQALLSFIESHGDTQILSSPRIATLNNQKAVLKVGTDDYFITGISGSNSNNATSSTGTTGTTNQIPTLTLTPFFSGIALDVTPQIDAADTITLHIHPSVSNVTEKVKQVDLGAIGNFRLPLASASVNETDTVVRIPDGHIVAIGGLMQMEASRRGSGVPGADGNPLTSMLFGNRANSGRKRELVVLIKPSIIRSAEDWEQHNRLVSESLEDTENRSRRVIRVNAAEPNTK
ncbi:secretin N-terminal domain-containing protein [Roseateles cellulosilyticus]|uniref:Secretin N-terminal domain-containing protein n=1 Tax=Pelomonas cellulosilytica TaxID=2906762 RepID=A0ABS8XVY4_9BURK|nr:secretin N-terminal domain-containing protein [Pelomonas sp. P8]MCE4555875.1 secretin N-terminal domain-containing protein [Pelomonas sp. P8]